MTWEGLADVAVVRLPALLDEHGVRSRLPPDVLWNSLVSSLPGFTSAASARVLGTRPSGTVGTLPDVGSTIRVADSVAESRLVLVGEHRLGTDALVFSIFDSGTGAGTELLATRYADFHRRG